MKISHSESFQKYITLSMGINGYLEIIYLNKSQLSHTAVFLLFLIRFHSKLINSGERRLEVALTKKYNSVHSDVIAIIV